MDEQDKLDRRVNDFAARSFRDIADGDYIAARMACRAQLYPQFLWSAQQAFEKYLKYILLVNRVPARHIRHDIKAALKLAEKVAYRPVLQQQTLDFIEHIADLGEYRYLDVSYFVEGHSLLKLDTAVWDLRRYCQVLDVFGKELPAAEVALLAEARAQLKDSVNRPRHLFRLHGGHLETILDNKKHPARSALVWQNPFFTSRRRTKIKVRWHLQAANAPLYLFPQMLDEVLRFVYVPKHLIDAYREHLKEIQADPSKAP